MKPSNKVYKALYGTERQGNKIMNAEMYHDWVMRIYYANIVCNNKGISEVVEEIARTLHKTEGEHSDG